MPTIKGGIKISKGKIVRGNLSFNLPFKATGWKSEKMPEGINIEEVPIEEPKKLSDEQFEKDIEEIEKELDKEDVKTVSPKKRSKPKKTSKARKNR